MSSPQAPAPPPPPPPIPFSPAATDATTRGLTKFEIWSAVGAIVATFLLILVAWRSYHAQSLFFLAASMGALGGIGHEFAQSGGRIVFIQRRGDGLYLGSLTGAVLGAIAGLLMIRGYLGPNVVVPYSQVAYETFTSGLALKGVVEALTDKPAPPSGARVAGGAADNDDDNSG
ncbi:MAG TPA: hypothetical protein VER32_07100 [Pyrinomonadaceae bacterium]|nr:hypothetical protein [Pyrinomonadaceae bacterium]